MLHTVQGTLHIGVLLPAGTQPQYINRISNIASAKISQKYPRLTFYSMDIQVTNLTEEAPDPGLTQLEGKVMIQADVAYTCLY